MGQQMGVLDPAILYLGGLCNIESFCNIGVFRKVGGGSWGGFKNVQQSLDYSAYPLGHLG
jgi:hypothetical protein